MSFTTESAKSVNRLNVLFQIISAELNEQWVNIGAGIWYVNFTNTYTFVDSTLLDYFSAQPDFAQIGGVTVDGIALAEAASLLEMSSIASTFYYDSTDRSLYIRLADSGEPFDNEIALGIVFGYSFDGRTPQGSAFFYEGRLLSIPNVSKSRDPLFYGKIQYGGGTVTLNNADGFFDSFIDENDIYGFECKVIAGYESMTYDTYQEIFTGYIENAIVSEQTVDITIADKRKQLSKAITYICTALNGLSAIEAILLSAYSNIQYTESFFDTTAWDAAKTQAQSVTINMQKPDAAISVIESICAANFGLFLILPDGRFSFKIIDVDSDATLLIPKTDINNPLEFSFDSSRVISSVRVGYNRNWTTTGTQYTYYTDTSREASVFSQYKTYNQREFDTILPTLTAATAFATTILDYNTQIYPTVSIDVSFEYYSIELGDLIYAELDRPFADMYGNRKCEVISIEYDFSRQVITLGLRRLNDILYYIGEDENTIITLDDYYWGASGAL
jgi:hypothetical protein